MRQLFVTLLIVFVCATAHADEFFPKKGWTDGPDPFASPDAEVGGQISVYLAQSPKSLNYYLDNSFQAAKISQYSSHFIYSYVKFLVSNM